MRLPSTFPEFADAVGKRESSNDYSAKNIYGYLGCFQFGLARLCDLGLTERIKPGYGNGSFIWAGPYSEELFLADHALQDKCFRKHMERHAAYVERKGWLRWIGTPVSVVAPDVGPHSDSIITFWGMLGVCHLLGPGGLRDLLGGVRDSADANGTHASDYVREFEHTGEPKP